MRTQRVPGERPVHWLASAKRDLLSMPTPVVREIGLALSVAQYGGIHTCAKPWKGMGSGVFEVVSDFDGNTFRAVYTVQRRQAVYVLHCFQKKSPHGIKTARTDIALVERRLNAARMDCEVRYGEADE